MDNQRIPAEKTEKLEVVLDLNNDRRKDILIYSFGLPKKNVNKMKMTELQSKTRELWIFRTPDNNYNNTI